MSPATTATSPPAGSGDEGSVPRVGWKRDARRRHVPVSPGMVVSSGRMGWSQLCHMCQQAELDMESLSTGVFRVYSLCTQGGLKSLINTFRLYRLPQPHGWVRAAQPPGHPLPCSQLSPQPPAPTSQGASPCPACPRGLSVPLGWKVGFLGAQSHAWLGPSPLPPQQQLLWGFLPCATPVPGFCCCQGRAIPRGLPKNTAAPTRAPAPPALRQVPPSPRPSSFVPLPLSCRR